VKKADKYTFLARSFVVTVVSTIWLLASCNKEPVESTPTYFFELTLDGKNTTIPACGSTDYVAQFLKDTALYSAFGCAGVSAGFYLAGKITDGNYTLDQKSQAWYSDGISSYATDSNHTGTLTIKTAYYDSRGDQLVPYVEGTFSFEGFDKMSGKIITVTNGRYRLKKYEY
jgi:hypothetical protein